MGGVRNLSIKGKLIWFAMLTSSMALILAGSVFTINDYRLFRDETVRELATEAEIIANNVDAAVQFEVFEDAEDVLSALRAAPSIMRAAVFLPDGRVFARYRREGAPDEDLAPQPPEPGHSFAAERLYVHHPIYWPQGDAIGVVVLEADLHAFNARIRGYVALAGGVLLLSILAAFFLSSRLQAMISEPVLHLAQVARVVSEKKDYAVRATLQPRGDELGVLVEGFNVMLEQIQQRDAALQRHRDDLERTIAERTMELTRVNAELREVNLQLTTVNKEVTATNARLSDANEELTRLNAELERATRYKSEVLAIMSHELRTPLNSVINYAKYLQRKMFGDLNEKQEEHVQAILASGTHLLLLIGDILDLAKIEAGRMDLSLSTFDVATSLSSMVAIVRQKAFQRRIELSCEMANGLGRLRADEAKLKRIFQNLLANALKFTDPGGKVHLRAVRQNGCVRISVSDTGVGIAPEDQTRIFEHFRQVGDRKRRREGTGLGLALVKGMVELHGGRIWVESTPGKGSTFTVELPDQPPQGEA